jgi:hypothetical protein
MMDNEIVIIARGKYDNGIQMILKYLFTKSFL